MKWMTIAILTAAVSLPGCTPGATTYYGFQVGVTNAPPPPRVVFHQPPRVILVPETRVYVVAEDYGYDVFRFGVFWYTYDRGYWYRARSYSGPFVAVDVRHVPRAIMEVPDRYWKRHPHGGPPGQRKKGHIG